MTTKTRNVSPAEIMTKPCGCPDLEKAISRRSFLKRSATAGVVAGIASQAMFTQLAFASAPYDGDVLVILSMRGGMDGLNAIVPAGDPDYLNWRPNIGVQGSALIQLDQTFAMHQALSPLKPLWDAGSFGVVHAVGQAQPNRSHFQAMEELERAAPGTSLRTGWLDRVLGLRDEGTAFQAVQMGNDLPASMFLGPAPELALYSVDGFGMDAAWDAQQRALWTAALRGVHTGAPDVLATPANAALDALSTAATLQELGYVPANGAVYPDTDLGHALTDVARLIKGDVGLQVAAVDYGDWDMHSDMGTPDTGWMHDQLTELSSALSAFSTDLGNKLNDVTLVTLTEFGRRVEENGSGGVDHGFGQVVMMLGGGVHGGQVHGQWPGLAEADLLDGDLNGVNDYRLILAEVLEKRCRAGSVSDIFPGLSGDRLDIVGTRA
ncbi:MAG: hypothetical protein QOI60_638 [Actinomycetota bacterium]|nr:hypothetical protein [Actinomycetota bacterium]